MKLIPTAGKALIKAEIPEDITDGGVLLPTDREGDPKDNPQIGKVIAIGPPEVKPTGLEMTMQVKVDDRVIFTDFYQTITGQKDAYFVEQRDIVAVIED